LGEILIQAGVLDENRLRVALREQQRWGGPLGRALVEMHLIREDDLIKALSVQLGIPAAPEIDRIDVPRSTLDLLASDFCEENAVLPFRQDGKFLDVALCDATNLSVLEEIRIRTRLNVRPYIAGPSQIERAIQRHYRGFDPGISVETGTIGAVLPVPAHLAGVRFIDFNEQKNRVPTPPPKPATPPPTNAEAARALDALAMDRLQKRVTELEAFLARDEAVLRKLLGLLVETRVVTHEQILACLQD
jgi:hypothetical protein